MTGVNPAIGRPWRRLAQVFRARGGQAVPLLAGALALVGLASGSLTAALSLQARSERDEFRSLSIRPLAEGGESGRHMGRTLLVRAVSSAPERAFVDLSGKLGPGDSLAAMLRRVGVPGAEAERAQALVGMAIPAGTQVDVTLGRRTAPGGGRPLQKVSLKPRFDLAVTLEQAGGELRAVHQLLPVSDTKVRLTGKIGASIYLSMRAAGAPTEAVEQYLRALDPNLSLEDDISTGDSFDMVVAVRRTADGRAQVGDVLYAGLFRDGVPRLQLMRWGREGGLINAATAGQATEGLAMPVIGRVTSNFGYRRHPILGYARLHAGTDIAAPWGSPVYAVTDGVVRYSGWHGGHGNFVELGHGSGFSTGYGHLSRIAVGVGESVRRGEIIGFVGSTGLSTGPHLHYEVKENGRPVNPLSFRFSSAPALAGPELAKFRRGLAQMTALPAGVWRQ